MAATVGVETEGVRVEVLGPLRVLDATGTDVTPTGTLQRRLLAFLVLRRDRGVNASEAIEALWPERLPRDAAAALQNQISRLRRALPAATISSTGDGYSLASEGLEVDADVLADAIHLADRDASTLDRLDAIVARWPGPAYPELADVDDGRIEAFRLEELRVRVLEVRAECRLAIGEAGAVVPELSRLVDEHPLRERPRSLLMEALERDGRRVEALRTYDDFRRRLGDDLGIEPSPALAAQHVALLDGTAPAAASASDRVATPNTVSRLPVPATSLIGREELLDGAAAAVEQHRIVTLVGPAGVGKTRLAVELGHRLRVDDDRPVAMCELAAVAPADVVEQVAAGLGIEPRAGTEPTERLADVLAGGPLVLLLDGCEHALDPVAGLVERLVGRCPALRVVVTSQERLRVPGEQVLSVPALGSNDGDAPAVRLFVERARAAAAAELTETELEVVAEITRRLDGLPLAIELAAARLHTHELAEVAAGLDERFSFLSSGYRGSTRHGSLRAAVSWSYDLLDDRLQRVLAQLSVFAGTFSAADAAAVCELDPTLRADDLAQLVERSLVVRSDGGRYTLLETLRAFGAEQLDAGGATDLVRDRHAGHFVTWVDEANRRLFDSGLGAIAAVEAALPDLRVALDHLLAGGHVDRASRLVAALRYFGFFRPRPDVLAWADRVAAADPDGSDPRAPLVEVARAYAAWLVGDVAGSAARSERALELSRAAGSVPSAVSEWCGTVALIEGRLDEAADWYRQGVVAAVEAGDDAERRFVAATELLALAYAGAPSGPTRADEVVTEMGDAETAQAAYGWYCAGEAVLGVDDELARSRLTRAVQLGELTGASLVVGLAGASRASIDARVGDPAVAVEAYRWLIPHWRRAGVWSTQWTMLRSIAMLLERLGRCREAAVLEGAVRSTVEGHRIFGADEEALSALGVACRRALGEEGYAAARREGTQLGGDAAADFALHALG